MNQTTFQLSSRAPAQADIILAELRRFAGEWVPMPQLAALSGAYAVHSRISDLRKRGYEIDHKNEVSAGRVTKSFYRLKWGAAG